jgi:DinB family protein
MEPEMAISLPDELERLGAAYRRIDALLGCVDDRLAQVAPAVSGWSAEQHLAHVALANELVFRNLRSLARGEGPFLVWEGGPPPEALEVLRSGVLPRGKSQSPRAVRPPEHVHRELLLQWLADNRRELADLEGSLDAIARARARVPHQLLGPLDASQWLRFCAMHTRHHVAIAEEVHGAR